MNGLMNKIMCEVETKVEGWCVNQNYIDVCANCKTQSYTRIIHI